MDENFDDGGAQDEADSSQAGAEDNDFDSEDSHSEDESFLQTKMAPKSRSPWGEYIDDDNGDDECERGDVTLHAKSEDATDYSMNESLVSVDGPGVEGAEETTVDGNADIEGAQDEVDKPAAEAEDSDVGNDAMPDDDASFFQT